MLIYPYSPFIFDINEKAPCCLATSFLYKVTLSFHENGGYFFILYHQYAILGILMVLAINMCKDLKERAFSHKT